MDEKPVAGLATAIVVAPLIAICCLGPLSIASALGSAAVWLSGQGLGWTGALAILAGAIGYAVTRWRKALSCREYTDPPRPFEAFQPWRNDELDDIDRGDQRRSGHLSVSGHRQNTIATSHIYVVEAPQSPNAPAPGDQP